MTNARAQLPRRIESEADIRAGIRALRRKCAAMRRMHDAAGDPPLRRHKPGFEGLSRIIVGQQVSLASAAAIWARCTASIAPFTPHKLLAFSDEGLKACGLSRAKIRTLVAVAAAIDRNQLDLAALEAARDEDAHAVLTAIHGIGPWTADIYLLFCLGRADSFAAGDLALQVAAQLALGLDARPGPADLSTIAERWRPWRGVAARMLWAYYKVAKEARSGMPV